MRARAFRSCAVLLLAIACLGGWLAPVAAAEFGPIRLVSKSSKEQAAFATEPALSEDGHFLAFIGQLGGHTGLFEKNLTTGAVTLVVEKGLSESTLEAPSISADGRFVSFTTSEPIDPEAEGEGENKDVYVADLGVWPPSFELVSSAEGRRMSGESWAAPRVAMSADGSEIAFVDEGQVYVHRAGLKEPILISSRKGSATPEPVPGGGVYQRAGAALSEGGNAVAWVGENVAEQVPLSPEEEAKIAGNVYQEPLWRLVPTEVEPNPPTLRIVGGGEPPAFPKLDEDHNFPRYSETGSPIGKGWGINLPVLSADGSTVAVIGSPEEIEDLFVVNMTSGLTRIQAIDQLTKWTNPNPAAITPASLSESQYKPYTGEILECAISPNGERIAFTTFRQNFAMGPSLATVRPAVPSVVPELYQVDLGLRTIERVTPGPGTGVSLAPSGQGAASLSYNESGRLLAFSDTAYNLVPGDANEGSDVFTVESTPPEPSEPSKISPPPSRLSVIPSWRLTARAVSRPNGAVRVVATVPGAGTLRASAKSPVGPRLHTRVVDKAQSRAATGGVVWLELKLPRRWKNLARRKGGLYAWLDLQFVGSGGGPLQQQFAARFRAHHPKPMKGKGK
jgi:hypothetical protein